MRNRGRVIGCLLLSIALIAAFTFGYAATKMPEQDITIYSTEVIKEPKKGPVTFPHVKHKALKCIDCHHEYKDGKNVWLEGQEVKKCQACHSREAPVSRKLETEGKVVKIDTVFHDQCVKCHKKMKEEKKPSGPTACTKCHPKTAAGSDDKKENSK